MANMKGEIRPAPWVSDPRRDHGRPDRVSSLPGGIVMHTIRLDEARAAKERAKSLFAGRAAVVGIGVTRIGDGYGVKVNLETPPAPDAGLPESIDGVPVRIEIVGTIRPR